MGSASPRLRFAATAVVFGCIYFLAAVLTDLLVGASGIAVLWPASGVYLGVMLVAPRRLWPALACGAALGSFAGYMQVGSSVELAIGFAIPSAAEGLLGALLVERIAGGRVTLRGLNDLFALVAGALAATALVGLSAAGVAAQTFDTSFADSWLRWWSADALGVLGFAPLVVALPGAGGRSPTGGRTRYVAFVVAGVCFALWIDPSTAATMVVGAVAFPLLLWVGWSRGSRATALGVAGLALAATHLASRGANLGVSANADVYVMQAFLAVLLLGALAFAAAVGDARSGQAASARARGRLRLVIDSVPGAYLAVDAAGRISYWSEGAERMFGRDAEQALGRSLDETIAPGAGPATQTTGELALLARHRDGRQFPVELTMRAGSGADDGVCHVFVRDLTENERMLGELRSASAELEQRRLTSSRQIEELRADLASRRDELRETERSLAAAERDLQRLGREHEGTASELARAREETRALEDNLGRLRDERQRLDEELAEAVSAARRAERELAESVSGRERVDQELAEAVSAREHLEHDLAEAVSARERAEYDLADSAAGRERAEHELAEAVAAARRAEHELAESASERQHLERDLAEAVSAARRAEQELAESVSARQRAEHDLAAAGDGGRRSEQELVEAVDGRRRAERALEDATIRLARSEAERGVLRDYSSELISRYDERGICLYVSPASRRLLGYEPQDLVGRPGAELLHPDDRSQLLRARATGSATSFEARLRRKEGDFVRVEVTLHPVVDPATGRVVELTTTVRELSGSDTAAEPPREAETRFNWLLATMPTGAALLAADGRLLRANLALCRLTGYSRDELEGAALATIVRDGDAPGLTGDLRRLASGEVATVRLVLHLAHVSDRSVPVELLITALPTGELAAHFQVQGDTAEGRDAVPRFSVGHALRP
jgi:PAS domain S-box-containing protein